MVLPSLISFQRSKNISDFLVRNTLKSDESPGTFNCTQESSEIGTENGGECESKSGSESSSGSWSESSSDSGSEGGSKRDTRKRCVSLMGLCKNKHTE